MKESGLAVSGGSSRDNRPTVVLSYSQSYVGGDGVPV